MNECANGEDGPDTLDLLDKLRRAKQFAELHCPDAATYISEAIEELEERFG